MNRRNGTANRRNGTANRGSHATRRLSIGACQWLLFSLLLAALSAGFFGCATVPFADDDYPPDGEERTDPSTLVPRGDPEPATPDLPEEEEEIVEDPDALAPTPVPVVIELSPAPPLMPAPTEQPLPGSAVRLPEPEPPPEKPDMAMAPARPALERELDRISLERSLPETPPIPDVPRVTVPPEADRTEDGDAPVVESEQDRDDRYSGVPGEHLAATARMEDREVDDREVDDREVDDREVADTTERAGEREFTPEAGAPEPVPPLEQVPGSGTGEAARAQEAARPQEATRAESDDLSGLRIVEPIRPPRREPERTTAERTVSTGDRFSVILQGHGWIYLGSSGPVDYIGRETDRDEVRFLFRAQPAEPDGTPITLTFEAQDLSTGWRRRHEEQVASEPARVSPPPVTRAQQPARPPARPPERTLGAGRSDTPEEREQESDAIREAPREVPFEERLRSAAAAEGPLTEQERALVAEVGPEIRHPRETLDLVERLVAAEESAEAIRLLEALLNSGAHRYDHVLFLLASLYERHGPHRDLTRSHDLYGQLVDQYPMSDHWETASARIEYLERHFLFIR